MSAISGITFDQHSSLGSDQCTVISKDTENQRINEYQLNGFAFGGAGSVCPSRQTLKDMELEHVNLRLKFGYGYADNCTVDNDSKVRIDPNSMTHDGHKQQLFTRLYQAVPNLGRGVSRPDIESRLLHSHIDETRHCTDGAPWDRFVPLVACLKNDVQNDQHIIPTWVHGGEATRDYVRRGKACDAFAR